MRKKWLIVTSVTIILAVLTVGVVFAVNHIKTVIVGNKITPDKAIGVNAITDEGSNAVKATGNISMAEGFQALPDVFRDVAGKFETVEIPVYIPCYLPGKGPFGLTEFNTSKNGYSFEVIKEGKPFAPVSMAYMIVNVEASQKPFSQYLTEEQLLSNPSGSVEFDRIKADSYGKGMEVIWTKNNWKFSALGHFDGDGVRVGKEILDALPKDMPLVPGAREGRFRVAQTGNPMYVTASWTNDGQTWYTLDGRSTPAETVKMLESVTRLDSKIIVDPIKNISGETIEYNTSFVLGSKVFFIDRDGNGWKDVTPKDAKGISNSCFIDRDNGWATSFDSNAHVKVYRTINGGRTWDVSYISEPGYSTDVSFVDKDHGWILIHQEGATFKEKAAVLQTKDGGATWNVVSRISSESESDSSKEGGIPLAGHKDGISFQDEKQGWIVLTEMIKSVPCLYSTKDGGLMWEGKNLDMQVKNDNDTVTAWSPIFFSYKDGILPVRIDRFNDKNSGGEPSQTYAFYTTRDSGSSWSASPKIEPPSVNGFLWSFYNIDCGYILNSGYLLSTSDSGKTWKAVNTEIGFKDIQFMTFLDDRLGWIITRQDGFFKTDDGGATWKKTS